MVKSIKVMKNSWAESIFNHVKNLDWFNTTDTKKWFANKKGISKDSYRMIYVTGDSAVYLNQMVARGLLKTKMKGNRRLYKINKVKIIIR